MTGMRKNNFRKWTAMAEIDLQKRRRKPVFERCGNPEEDRDGRVD